MPHPTNHSLKGELQCSLQDARRRGTDDISEGRTPDIAVNRTWSAELRVVENIECFDPEEQRLRFCERQVLLDGHVKVVRTRAVEKSPSCVAWRTQRVHGEDRSVKVVVVILARVLVQAKWAAAVIGFVDAGIIDPVGIGPNQRIVSVVDHGDRETTGKMTDARKRPSLGHAIGMKPLIERELVFVTDDNIVLHIEGGEAIAERGIEGVDLLADVRGLVHRPAVGVGGRELEPPTGMAGAQLESIVIGGANRRLQRIAAKIRP